MKSLWRKFLAWITGKAKKKVADVVIDAPADTEPSTQPSGAELPFAWSEVDWIKGASVADYAEVFTISDLTITSSGPRWTGAHPERWPDLCDDCNGAIGWVTQTDGKWIGVAACELLRHGMTYQTLDAFKSRDGVRFDSPYREWKPAKGQTYYVFVVSARAGFEGRGPLERSNVVEATYQ